MTECPECNETVPVEDLCCGKCVSKAIRRELRQPQTPTTGINAVIGALPDAEEPPAKHDHGECHRILSGTHALELERDKLRAEVDALTLRLTGGGKTFAQLLGEEPYTAEQAAASVMRFYGLPDNGVRACMIGMLKDRDREIERLRAALQMVKANRQCASNACEMIADSALAAPGDGR